MTTLSMNIYIKPILLSILFLLVTTLPALAAPNIGERAPDFEAVNTLTGQPFKLSNHRGELLVLEWTNHDCPFVRKHYSTNNMQILQKEAKGRGVTWVSVVSSAKGRQGYTSAKGALKIARDAGAAPAVKILDPFGEIGNLYGARTTPHMFVIDKQGVLAYSGAIDDNPSPDPVTIEGATNYVREALDDLASGRKVQTPHTRPYGCGVKYAH